MKLLPECRLSEGVSLQEVSCLLPRAGNLGQGAVLEQGLWGGRGVRGAFVR